MSFFEYFDAGYALVIGLSAIAALTPTTKDDHVLSRVQNIMSKIRNLFKKN
jgi:hypothetical protein